MNKLQIMAELTASTEVYIRERRSHEIVSLVWKEIDQIVCTIIEMHCMLSWSRSPVQLSCTASRFPLTRYDWFCGKPCRHYCMDDSKNGYLCCYSDLLDSRFVDSR